MKICEAVLSPIKEENRVFVGERKFAVLFNDILFFNLFTVLQWNIELFLKEIICEDLKSKLSALLTIQPHIEAQMTVNAQLSDEVERYSQIFLFLYSLKHSEYAELLVSIALIFLNTWFSFIFEALRGGGGGGGKKEGVIFS